MIQQEFTSLVDATNEVCLSRFGNRLLATYLAGSVARGEAWPGASDLDWFVFLRDEPTSRDKAWRRGQQANLQARFPAASEVHLNIYSLARLRRESFWQFILRYNAVRIRGPDVIAQLQRKGLQVPHPSRRLARSRLPFVKQCLSEALAGRCPAALAELPRDPFLATRKLARNFVIVEGAFVLMGQGRFKSFKQEAVLRGLCEAFPRWRPLLRKAEAIFADPYRAGIRPDTLMSEVGPFMNWAISLTE